MSKMSDNFYKIKRKHLISAIVKSAVCGISLGLIVTGVLLLALKLSAIDFAVLYYVLIGVGAALLGGGASFLLLFRPTDKKVAKRTDDDYSLNERVQTAVEYSDKSGTVVEMQRQDAEEKIKSLPRRRFSFARIWQLCLIMLVAFGIAAAGIFVPAKAVEEEPFIDPDSTPREVTELERAGVRELIANVTASSLVDELKTPVVEVLEQLLVDLDSVHTVGTLAHALDTAIDGADAILSASVTYVSMGAALTVADQAYLGQAVTSGGNVYQYYMLTAYDEVRSFSSVSYDAINVKVVKAVSNLRTDLALPISSGLSEELGDTASGVTAALTASGVSEDDAVYALLKSFADKLSSIKSDADRGGDDTAVQTSIGDLITSFNVNMTKELTTQSYNAAMNVFVANRLKIIFGYGSLVLPLVDNEKSEDKTDTPDPGEKEDPVDPNDPNNGGANGPGDTVYGSDDEVWVPGRGYMKYGEVIDEYYSLINQYLHSDDLTEEQKNMIRAYYDILFGSNKNK